MRFYITPFDFYCTELYDTTSFLRKLFLLCNTFLYNLRCRKRRGEQDLLKMRSCEVLLHHGSPELIRKSIRLRTTVFYLINEGKF